MEDEQQPSPHYLKGFNNGYLLAQYEPELLNNLLASPNPENEYMQAMAHGKNQFEQEKLVAEMKQIREKQKHNLRRKR
ncbi:hypothetical protein [Siphonobacter sp. SORGH_AS_1065]|uniref:hypothetical protein n=1 Tax=Siphonobacter sp. SORGH_AS_1065 TaxID=3041795 RepID=UPI00277F0547|nr:hypothetical protein [Siphonobacter sp. SORGH_AS_1065]MDQ1086146.1 hypothetical protein [Siphonobacter sp. SORGH_AS_1065]